jgi:hypothetical protein
MLAAASFTIRASEGFSFMSDQTLLAFLRGLNYDRAAIGAIMSAAEKAEAATIERLEAERDTTGLLTKLQCQAQSERHAAMLRQVDSQIYQASGCKWRLSDGHVDVHEVDRQIRGAHITTRAAIKSALHELGLIR